MKRWVIGIVGVASMSGCSTPTAAPRDPVPLPTHTSAITHQPTQPTTKPAVTATHSAMPAEDEVIARAGQVQVTRGQLAEPLIEAYGLDALLQLITLALAEDSVRRQNLVVSSQDVQTEMEQTVHKIFKDAPKEDYEKLLQQFLAQYRLTRPQFEASMAINAHLRKLAAPMLEGKVTEEKLREAFGALYGETLQVRHIQLTNMQEVGDAQRRLQAGEDFASIARALSRNAKTAGLGGELPAFSRQMQGLPDSFKDAAFALKEGEVSDPVQAEGSYHLIKLEKRVAPRAVEFEDHSETVRQQLYDNMITQVMRQLRDGLVQEAMERIDIEHPVLREQFEERRKAKALDAAGRDDVLRDMQRRREQRETAPATAPAP